MAPLLAAFDTSYFLERLKPDDLLWSALWLTVYISVVSQVIGTLIGVVSATCVMSRFWPLRFVAGVYTWIFRGTPVYLQIAFWYFGLTIIPNTLELGPISLDGAVVAGIVALSLNEGAYMSEIV